MVPVLDSMYKMQCNEHYNKHSRTAAIVQRYAGVNGPSYIKSNEALSHYPIPIDPCSLTNVCTFFLTLSYVSRHVGNTIDQKQYTDLFALAAEDETSGVGRRGGSARGRRPPPNKKDTNSTNCNSKKNAEPINNVYSSDEQSSDVSKSKYTEHITNSDEGFQFRVTAS